MAKREYVLKHSSELNALTTNRFFRTRGLGILRLGGVMDELPERERWETELNRSYYACGCSAGATGLIFGLIAGVVAVAIPAVREPLGTWLAAGLGVTIALCGAIIGKVTGLVQAQGRLNRTIREIQAAAGPREPKMKEGIICG
jgi:Flp pilus assembly pilin Flp